MEKQEGNDTHKAFLSYRTSDEKLAGWLQNRLETYRVPRGLVGKTGEFGPIPRRLGRIFRDRDEARTEEDIEGFISVELANSEHLIVLCTPRAVEPRSWVGREIEIFRKRRPYGKIHAVVGDGEPPACFPTELLTNDPTGRLRQPLAADLRPKSEGGQDGSDQAVVKIVAGLIGVRFDDLWRRERRRRIVRRIVAVAVGLLTLGIAGGGLFAARQSSLADWYMSISNQAVDAHHWDTAALAAASSMNSARWLGPLYPNKAVKQLRGLRGQARTRWLLKGHTKAVNAVAVDPLSGVVFTVSDDRRIHAWRTEKTKMVGRVIYRMPPGLKDGMKFSQSKRLLAVFSGRNLAIFDSQSGSARFKLRIESKIQSIDFVGTGQLLVIARADGKLDMLEGNNFSTRRVIHSGASALTALAASPAGDQIAFGDDDGNAWLHIVDKAETRHVRKSDPADSTGVSHIAFGNNIFAVSVDDAGEIYDKNSGEVIEWFSIDDRTVDETHLDRQSRIAVSLLSDFRLNSWDVKTGNLIANLLPGGCIGSDAYTCRATRAMFTKRPESEEDHIVAGYLDGTIRIWKPTGILVAELRGHVGPVAAIVASKDGERLFTASEDRSARVWQLDKATNPDMLVELFCRQTASELLDFDSNVLKNSPLRFNVEVDRSETNSQALLASLSGITARQPCK